ncbi:MAG: cobalamin biosynthesis protein [Maledivibacter sp.]|jgi:L-threonine kinase|nr:cobalamin biosynthesis protein [Maledivibacter sp.]
MKIKVKCPASCGELIQGVIGDGEKLISLPIDIYSEVTLFETKKPENKTNRKKAFKALQRTFEYFNTPKEYIENISLEINSNIPIAKGMASSTADIAATVISAAELLGKKLTPKELGELCCKVEPTDSIIFDKLTLFDHIKGRAIKEYEWNPSIKILILELDSILDTEEFRKNDYSKIRLENQNEIERAHEIFSLACKNKDKKLLGKAATISAIANQKLLFKPAFNEVVEIATKLNAYGVNVAHSGTVIGILYDEKETDVDRLKATLCKRNMNKHYIRFHTVNMVAGGVRAIK